MASVGFKFDVPVNSGKDSVIPAHPHVCARQKVRASLPNNDGSGPHDLSIIPFDPQSFGVTVSSIAAGAATFFVCHSPRLFLSDHNLVYANRSQGLPMASLQAIAFSSLIFVDNGLSAQILGVDGAQHASTSHSRMTDFALSAVVEKQNLIEHELIARLSIQFLHLDAVTLTHFVLFTTYLNDRVHRPTLPSMIGLASERSDSKSQPQGGYSTGRLRPVTRNQANLPGTHPGKMIILIHRGFVKITLTMVYRFLEA